MSRRTMALVSATLGTLTFEGGGPAAAQTWDDVAAVAEFSVYKPARTLGLGAWPPTIRPGECTNAADDTVGALYGLKGPDSDQRSIVITQASPSVCARPGSSRVLRRVRVLGKRVPLRVGCSNSAGSCRIPGPRKRALQLFLRIRNPEGTTTAIQINAAYVLAKRFILMARSLRPVDLTRPVVRYTAFTTPDKQIRCRFETGDTPDLGCLTKADTVGARLTRDGALTTCQDVVLHCSMTWDASAPALLIGQRSRNASFSCTAEPTAMTCLTTAGDQAGGGFRISQAGVETID